ncbi:hypothetical protein [Gloeocapsopsis dulcis]|uniref:HEPN domain-containing protein n=1 Tax=Gloeocapsopsis dulcis AAB1 = 1H9 TaxID=1433147 RepID=A0A6N8G1E2_9CHRO|nr:hypothetical protein [Gloeocapsopsis dulcis]MUL38764.1 hypothetical protein [Gloeocapsopsis dulcis AAB1 = 1H9]WNN91810.1 hypothetical protein P0S91_12385 [Gloeocapsopsis dulcis]
MAEQLIKKVNFPDYQAYPVVFLYRHSFELNLKNVIYWSARLLAFKGVEDVGERLYNTHNLIKLAANAERILLKAFPDDPDLHEFVQDVISTAKEFSDIDPDSYSYRYPISTRGDYSTRLAQSVNLSSLSDHMASLLENLDTINFGLNLETDIEQEVYEAYLNL